MKVSFITAAIAALGFAQAAPMPQDPFADLPPPGPLGPVDGSILPEPETSLAADIKEAVGDIAKRGVATDNFVKVFDGLTASTQTGGYITVKFLTTYSEDACAQKCLESTKGCVFFNLYIEHGANPDSIKCALYSIASTSEQATNYGGQIRDGEGPATSKTQSQGWRLKSIIPEVAGYTRECFGAASINAPRELKTYMGVTYSTTSAEACAAACSAKNAANEKAAAPGATYRVCNFFNFYNVYQDGVGYQNACTFYLVSYDVSYATNYSGQERNGHVYSIGESCGYTRKTLVGVDGYATKPGGAPTRR